MSIDQVQFTEHEFRNFFLYYKDLPHQQKAVEILRQCINAADPTLLVGTADWVDAYRQSVKPIPGRTTQAGLEIIKEFEGLALRAYYCPAGVLTIGYGQTGPHIYEGMIITPEQAENMLLESVKEYERGVADAVKVALKPNEFDALVSFAYNVGLGALNSSTLLRRLNDGEKPSRVIVEELPKWCMASGAKLPGLVRRREAEIRHACKS